jgi:O-acetyl-ADP-ribose deacetylase (regulator of RNase III)
LRDGRREDHAGFRRSGAVHHSRRRAGLSRCRHGEAELLASTYRRSLEVAVQNGVRTLAFPAISTGVYGYPFRAATEIAFRTVAAFLKREASVDEVTFVFHGQRDFDAACELFERLRTEAGE